MIVDVRNQLHAQPFRPFVIHVADGRELRVPTADHAHVWPGRARVSVYTDHGLECILPGLLISGIDVEGSAEDLGNGQNH